MAFCQTLGVPGRMVSGALAVDLHPRKFPGYMKLPTLSDSFFYLLVLVSPTTVGVERKVVLDGWRPSMSYFF